MDYSSKPPSRWKDCLIPIRYDYWIISPLGIAECVV